MELARVEIDKKLWELFYTIERAIDDNSSHKCIDINSISNISDELFDLITTSGVEYE